VAAAWRLILGDGNGVGFGAARGARNMAIDHALFESAQQLHQPALRLYAWDPPCLSLGRNQRATGIYDPARAAAAGIDIVRRPTGGLAVLHDREVTYSVMAPLAALDGPRAAYVSINAAIVAALRACGVPAELAASGPTRRPAVGTAAPCFDAPAAGEVVAAGRKLVGSAQRCERRTLLQHGSVLLDGSQQAVVDLMTPGLTPTDAAGGGSITLSELLGAAPDPDRLVQELGSAFENVFGTRLAPDALTRDERTRADWHAERYAAATWTWRL
jgi:lipoyl(octanoyl) transferase